MNMNQLLKLESTLPLLETLDGLQKPHSFIREGVLRISGEHGDNAIDYYGEYRGGYPYIDPKLEAWATKKKGYWEWENPGSIGFFKHPSLYRF